MNIFEGDLLPMQVWAKRVEAKLNLWAAGIAEGVSTGFVDLDKYMRLVGGEYTLIAARPSMGKTSFGMQLADNVAKNIVKTGDNGITAIFSAEMSGTELTIRMVSAYSGVNNHVLRSGYGSYDEIERFRDSLHYIQTMPIWMDDSSGPTTAIMLERLAEMNKSNPVRLMLFDFVELAGDTGRSQEEKVSNIHRHLKGIAKTLDIPVIGLSQLNRDVESRADKMPQLADLRGSGMGEQIADKVVFIMRPEYYVERRLSVEAPEEDRQGVAYLLVAKNRTGPVGLARLQYQAELSRFGNLTRQETK